MSSDWMREHIETNSTKGGAPMRVVCDAFRAKERGVVWLLLLGVLQCLRTGFVSTKGEIRTGEVVCVVFMAKERGVVS
jgi:hypothetical protein